MSRAQPMDMMTRRAYYAMQRNIPPRGRGAPRLTPRQNRRAWHKEGRADPGWNSVDVDIPEAQRPKGRPTPRRPRAIDDRQLRRVIAEAQRTEELALRAHLAEPAAVSHDG